ncbi:dehydrogenase [Dissulfurispira thermophila]|uniref:Dehydrogenase n=2 Tax=root TaxID=1 RepID=A0A7G1H0B5_9BACT|nr:molecular chaperone TorD family protein [Dissulfurispira thermophila]BCB96220.1 dehydrogenase [Dissulfurispira thermophila]
MIDELREELYLYNLLRQVFLREPTKELVTDISNISLSEEEEEADDEINHGLKIMIDSAKNNLHRLDEWLEELALEYARLFIGPKNPPAVPYASFYLSESHSLMTEETIDVRKRYLEANMAVKNLYSIPDDHIGIELEFIYYLTQKIIELFEQGQREDASRLFEIRSNFLSEHVSQWVPFFSDKVLDSTQEDFYKGAALILRFLIY